MAPHCYLSCVQPFPFMWFCAFCNSVCYKKFARYRSESVDTAEVVMWWHFCSELEFYIACTDCNHICEFNDKLQPLSLPVCPLLQMSVRFMIKGNLGAISGPSWGHLGAMWSDLVIVGPSSSIVNHLGVSLGHLGSYLGPSMGQPGPSWGDPGAISGPSCGHFGTIWTELGIVGVSWSVVGFLGVLLGPSWRPFGPIMVPTWTHLGPPLFPFYVVLCIL